MASSALPYTSFQSNRARSSAQADLATYPAELVLMNANNLSVPLSNHVSGAALGVGALHLELRDAFGQRVSAHQSQVEVVPRTDLDSMIYGQDTAWTVDGVADFSVCLHAACIGVPAFSLSSVFLSISQNRDIIIPPLPSL
jgi:hypothetical protein